jgi:cob(I)alamin adenosyltransferase
MKIYTKSGDKGETSLVGGERVPKDCIRLESYGNIDELNAQLGLLHTYLTDEHDRSRILDIQNELFVVGSNLATDTDKRPLHPNSIITTAKIEQLEQEIDALTASLPPMTGFILPGGARSAAVCHVCRTVCRRAERTIVQLSRTANVDENLLRYINRLSDYLFVLSRKLNKIENIDEILWKKTC